MSYKVTKLVPYTREELLAMDESERSAIDICTCGDPRSAHGGLMGHGPALDPSAGCQRFTWAGFAPKRVPA